MNVLLAEIKFRSQIRYCGLHVTAPLFSTGAQSGPTIKIASSKENQKYFRNDD